MVFVCFSMMELGGEEFWKHWSPRGKNCWEPKAYKIQDAQKLKKKKKDLGSQLRRAMKTHIIHVHVAEKYSVLVVVLFHPWFKFYFLCFKRIVIRAHCHTQKQRKRKFKPRIKLNRNIHLHHRWPTWRDTPIKGVRGMSFSRDSIKVLVYSLHISLNSMDVFMFFTWGVDTGGLGAGAGAGLGYKTKRKTLLSEKDNDTCIFLGKEVCLHHNRGLSK